MARYFTTEHEWIEVDGDTATIGITDHAQSQLGDLVFVDTEHPGLHGNGIYVVEYEGRRLIRRIEQGRVGAPADQLRALRSIEQSADSIRRQLAGMANAARKGREG